MVLSLSEALRLLALPLFLCLFGLVMWWASRRCYHPRDLEFLLMGAVWATLLVASLTSPLGMIALPSAVAGLIAPWPYWWRVLLADSHPSGKPESLYSSANTSPSRSI